MRLRLPYFVVPKPCEVDLLRAELRLACNAAQKLVPSAKGMELMTTVRHGDIPGVDLDAGYEHDENGNVVLMGLWAHGADIYLLLTPAQITSLETQIAEQPELMGAEQ
jgi:hypothetical protein